MFNSGILALEMPGFISQELWQPNNLDLNPSQLDQKICCCMQ